MQALAALALEPLLAVLARLPGLVGARLVAQALAAFGDRLVVRDLRRCGTVHRDDRRVVRRGCATSRRKRGRGGYDGGTAGPQAHCRAVCRAHAHVHHPQGRSGVVLADDRAHLR
jgi:hypothetical protein